MVIEITNSTFINNLAVALNLHMLNPGDAHRQIREVGAVSVVLLSFGYVNLSNCTFSANLNGALGVNLSPPYCGKWQHLTFSDVMVYNTNDSSTTAGYGSVSIAVHSAIGSLIFEKVNFVSNHFLGQSGSDVLYIAMYGEDCNQTYSFISIRECVFERNVALNYVLALYTTSFDGEYSNYHNTISFKNCTFDYNVGSGSIVNIMAPGSRLTMFDSSFSNNNGTALYIDVTYITFSKNLLFKTIGLLMELQFI